MAKRKAKKNPRKTKDERARELSRWSKESLRSRVKQLYRVVDVRGAGKATLAGMILHAEGYYPRKKNPAKKAKRNPMPGWYQRIKGAVGGLRADGWQVIQVDMKKKALQFEKGKQKMWLTEAKLKKMGRNPKRKKNICVNMIKITLHPGSYPTLIDEDAKWALRERSRGAWSPSMYKDVLRSKWKNLGRGGGYASGLTFRRVDPETGIVQELVETFNSDLGVFVLRRKKVEKNPRKAKSKKRKNPLLMVVPNGRLPRSIFSSDHAMKRYKYDLELRRHTAQYFKKKKDATGYIRMIKKAGRMVIDERAVGDGYVVRATRYKVTHPLHPKKASKNPLLMVVPNKGKKGRKAKAKKNPPKAWHKKQVEQYRKRLADDLKAKHKGGADYWQGATSAETRALAKHGVNSPRLRKLMAIVKRKKAGYVDGAKVIPALAGAILKVHSTLDAKGRKAFEKANLRGMARVAKSVAARC